MYARSMQRKESTGVYQSQHVGHRRTPCPSHQQSVVIPAEQVASIPSFPSRVRIWHSCAKSIERHMIGYG